MKKHLSNDGTLRNAPVINAFFAVVKFVTPVLLVLVLLNGLQIIK